MNEKTETGTPHCPRCGSDQLIKNGVDRDKQNYLCKACNHQTLHPQYNGIPINKPKATGIFSESDIREKYDWNHKIRQAVLSIPEGQFYEESTFRELADVPVQYFRRYAESGEFDEFKGTARGKTYWGHPKSVGKLKEENIFN